MSTYVFVIYHTLFRCLQHTHFLDWASYCQVQGFFWQCSEWEWWSTWDLIGEKGECAETDETEQRSVALDNNWPSLKNVRRLWPDGGRWSRVGRIQSSSSFHPFSSFSTIALQLFIRERERDSWDCVIANGCSSIFHYGQQRRQRRKYHDDITGESIDSRDNAISEKHYSLSLSL